MSRVSYHSLDPRLLSENYNPLSGRSNSEFGNSRLNNPYLIQGPRFDIIHDKLGGIINFNDHEF